MNNVNQDPSKDAYLASLGDDLASISFNPNSEDVKRIAAEAAEHMLAESSRANAAEVRAELAEKRADTDELTGLKNRAAIVRDINERIAKAETDGSGFGVLFFDLRNFKRTNDLYGHEAGNAVLKHFADVLTISTRHTTADREGDIIANEPHYATPEDRPDNNKVSRLSGDEFIVLLEGAEDREQIRIVAERIMGRFYSDAFLRDSGIGVSFGGANWRPGMTTETLLNEADQAMMAHKQTQGESYRPTEAA